MIAMMEPKVFDWLKAAELIRERKPEEACAGLAGDWEYTGGAIYRNGAPVPKDETYVYLASNHATPGIELDGETIPCFKLKSQTPGWGAETYWPEEALAILNAP
jgi:hypothetical protein